MGTRFEGREDFDFGHRGATVSRADDVLVARQSTCRKGPIKPSKVQRVVLCAVRPRNQKVIEKMEPAENQIETSGGDSPDPML